MSSVVKEIVDAIRYSAKELDYDRQDGRIGGVGRIRALCDLLDEAYVNLDDNVDVEDEQLRNRLKEILPEWGA